MPPLSRLDPGELADALVSVHGVVADHAAALDRLDLGEPEPLDPASDEIAAAPGVDPDRSLGAGSDLERTLGAVVATLGGRADLTSVLDAFAAARPAARSDAGRALAAVLDGVATATRNSDHLDGARLAIGLELAAASLGGPEASPHARGSAGAVVASAADAALGAVDDGAGLLDVLVAAADDGLEELEAGPSSNPELIERGVVDPAAAGVLLVLDALSSVVSGDPLPSAPREAPGPATPAGRRYLVRCDIDPHHGADVSDLDLLGVALAELGAVDALTVERGRWALQMVTGLPGAAIEVIVDAGRPRDLRIDVVETEGPV